MKSSKVSIPWKQGLHLRSAADIVENANSFESSIELKVNKKTANARSIFSILLLTATMGTVKFWPALVQAWVRGCVSKGRLEGVCELISGLVGSEKTPQTAGKPPAFKAAVADVLQASSDELWMAARASFPDA